MALFAAGCGKNEPKGELTGSVTFNGESVSDCRVSLYNSTTMRTIGGKVDENGEFKIVDIPVGKFQVAIKQRTTNAVSEEPFDERIPEQYRSSDTSGFSVEIAEGENTLKLEMTD
jgi:hypothetical protein